MNALAAERLRYTVRPHFWSRPRRILADVSFAVPVGQLFGFLGPNGAGKTTTIKVLLGLLRAEAGTVHLLGGDPTTAETRKRVGFMPERAYFPSYLTGQELVLGHALLAGLSWSAARAAAAKTLDRVGLTGAAKDRLGTYSKGMLQRIGLAQALVGDPELVILDEPMSGLDPLGRRDVRELMVELRDRGKTVFFSTHILPDVEAICDQVAILVGGAIRRAGTIQDLLGHSVAHVEIVARGSAPGVEQELRAQTQRLERRGENLLVWTRDLDGANRAIDLLRQHGYAVSSVQAHRRTLEDLFVSELHTTSEASK